MTCQNCAKQVENALNAIDGVWVEVDLKQNRAMVRQKEQISVEKLCAAVEKVKRLLLFAGRLWYHKAKGGGDMELETKRLRLRPLTEQDAEGLFAYCSHPDVGPAAGWKPHETLEESREILEQVFLKEPHVFAIEQEGRLIGTVGLVDDNKRENAGAKMIGYSLAFDCWGKGIMTEAVEAVLVYGFDLLNLSIITATCYPDNPASAKVLEKCGFVYEGTLRQAQIRFDGKVQDFRCYSVTKAEYDEKRRGVSL